MYAKLALAQSSIAQLLTTMLPHVIEAMLDAYY
jgi:hypothetical protein